MNVNHLNLEARPPADTGVEDLDAVLGKFRAWDASRRQTAGKKPLRQDQSREVTYEEALSSISRYRKSATTASQQVQPIKETAAADCAADFAEDAKASSKRKAAAASVREPRHTATTVRLSVKKVSAATKKPIDDEQRPPAARRRRQPSFRAAVEQQVAIQKQGRDAVERVCTARDQALTIRLTQPEAELIRFRAAEAKVSVSGYLRQCALEVELLRKHVEGVLEELRVARHATATHGDIQKQTSASPGALAQGMRRSWMDRLRNSLLKVFSRVVGAPVPKDTLELSPLEPFPQFTKQT